ncbi:MAG TPA: ATP-binding protein [Vicinamibacterales bacterium]|nr:ATP-binding protein [Vicinamibacterales bacterium]
MTVPDLIDRLAAHRTLGAAPREELAWLAAHGSFRHVNPGEVVAQKGQTVEELWVVLSGRIAIFVDRGTGVQKMVEWRPGDVTGLLPYSRLTTPPGNSIAQEPTEILALHRDHLPEMIRACQTITSILVHSMLDRARIFTSNELHDEKMLSLGKLSAGLAHELNNPASAIERSATLLEDRLDDGEQATRLFAGARLTEAQLTAVDRFRTSCHVKVHGVPSPLEQAEREEEIADWLEAHNVDPGIADAIAETPTTIESLDRLSTAIDGPALEAVLRWTAAACSVRNLASEIQDAATRISGLVVAIKGFTHMDQATAAEPVDLVQSLGNTVAVLKSKARNKSASIAVDIEQNLPHVQGFAGELNQIWVNLIDNALDAIAKEGRVEVHAGRDGGRVLVRVVDNGPGIPGDIRDRIFDPFFTTKPMGLGTGLGLDIVRRLVRHNDGEIAVNSRPGRTEFRVLLPTVDNAAGVTS